jgi:hypothetical protein
VRKIALLVLSLIFGGSAILALRAGRSEAAPPMSASAAMLEALRNSGDMPGQRRHIWDILAHLTAAPPNGTKDHRAFFENWHGEDELFSNTASGISGIGGFSRTGTSALNSQSGAPVLTYTFYNEPAYRHIRGNRLNSTAELDRLRQSGRPDDSIAGDRALPVFPADSIVLKTVWWPVARDGLTALPVWDPEKNPPRPNGNPYINWQRVVAVDPATDVQADAMVGIDFAGRNFPRARRIGIGAFYHVAVDAPMAGRMMRDPETRKAVLIALGRPLQAGDYLVLVAANMAAREIPDWIWASFWWHDRPEQGVFAADRPQALQAPWRNYLMQTAFDSEKPEAADAGPHTCFNPWLEGRFPDGGNGGGTASNCMACHQRASYPPVAFLPVRRGAPDLRSDPAFAPGRLRTSFLWSLAMHAKP